jgi:hypothetical protein
MNLKAKRIQGGRFSADDKLEVSLDTDGAILGYCAHTPVVISGTEVTHGGGAPSSEFLHYRNIDTDADAYGVIDYSTVLMNVTQIEKGTSVIKIKIEYLTTVQQAENIEAKQIAEENEVEFVPPHAPSETETGQLTLEWLEDTFV